MVFYPIEKYFAKKCDAIITITDEDYTLASKKFKTKVIRMHGAGVDGERHHFVEDAEKNELSFSKKLLNHVIVGADYFITDNISVSAGYNFRRAYELKAAGSSHGAGLSAGATLHLKQFMVSAAYAKYHKSTSSLMFNVSYAL